MKTFENKKQENRHQAISAEVVQNKHYASGSAQFIDSRAQVSLQRKMQSVADESPFTKVAAQFKAMMNGHAGQQSQLIQNKNNEPSLPDNPKSGIEFDAPSAPQAETRQADVSELSEDDAHRYITASFKNGGGEKPLVNSTGALIQRAVTRSTHEGGELFSITKSDLGTGTATTQGTRDYVNDAKTYKPDTVLFDYATGANKVAGKNTVTARDEAHKMGNPEADRSYKSGKIWDAGHKLGRQNGGKGDENDWVFPQNPALNQGNRRNMDGIEETHTKWRAHEDEFRKGVDKDGAGAWWIKLT